MTQAEAPWHRSERFQRHLTRLHVLVEMGVIDQPPAEQMRKIVGDCIVALDFDYAEIGVERVGEPDGYVKLCTVGVTVSPDARALGWRGLSLTKAHMVFDTKKDPLGTDAALAESGLASVLFWPFQADGARCVLTVGWKTQRDHFISEEEIQYLNFLTALVTRLLDAAERERRISERVDKDPLTGIPNRTAMFEQLAQTVSSAQRSGTQAAVLYIDLNHFKRLNDEHGHSAGDLALTEIAKRMQTVLRKHEVPGRIGGDEFAVVVSSFASRTELDGIARRILSALTAPIEHESGQFTVSASIGIAIYPRDGNGVNELLAHADQAMYRAKSKGVAGFAYYGDTDPVALHHPLRIDAAAFDSQLVLCYQPIVAAQTLRPIAAEILVRWLHPDQGILMPRELLNAAREQDTLAHVERLLFTAAVRKAGQLSARSGPIAFHINVSAPSDTLLELAPAGQTSVALEFAEEQVSLDPERYVAFIAACRSRGYRVGLSQFGSGRLSLRTLSQLRLDFVKIDAGMMRETIAVIEQAHRMSCTVIAEGIEGAVESRWLSASGVDALQGFDISSPLTEQDFLNWLRYRALQ